MEFEKFLRDNAIAISIAAFVLIAICLILYLVLPRILNKKKREEPTSSFDEAQFYLALGGKENVKALNLNGSRLSVELNDMDAYSRDQLRELGVVRIITMKEKLILLVDDRFSSLIEKK